MVLEKTGERINIIYFLLFKLHKKICIIVLSTQHHMISRNTPNQTNMFHLTKAKKIKYIGFFQQVYDDIEKPCSYKYFVSLNKLWFVFVHYRKSTKPRSFSRESFTRGSEKEVRHREMTGWNPAKDTRHLDEQWAEKFSSNRTGTTDLRAKRGKGARKHTQGSRGEEHRPKAAERKTHTDQTCAHQTWKKLMCLDLYDKIRKNKK